MNRSTPIGIGMIGTGMIAQDHLTHLSSDKRCRVVSIAGRNAQRLTATADRFDVIGCTTDYRELLEDPAVDAVFICTPPALHHEIFIRAVNAGKHVMIEKPLGLTLEQVNAMEKAAAKHPELVICDASCRHSRLQPKFSFVKNLVESGELGEIYHIHHNSVVSQFRPGIEYHPSAKWFLDKKMAGGGPSFDWGVYDLSFHLGILGDRHTFKSVRAFTRNGLDRVAHGAPVFDVEEHLCAMMEFDNGLSYYWERASNAHNSAPNQSRIYGTKGGIRLSFCTWDSSEVTIYSVNRNGRGKARSKAISVSQSRHPGDNKALDRHFIDCIEKGVEPAMPVSLAAKHIRVILKVLKAANPL